MSDILASLSLGVSLIALGSVYFAWKTLESTRNWERVKAVPLFLDADRSDSLSSQVDIELESLGIAYDTSLTRTHVELILANPRAKSALTRLLTYYERFACAINVGAIDNDVAYHMAVGEVLAVHNRYKSFIAYKREKNIDSEVMANLSTLAVRWSSTKALRRDEAQSSGSVAVPNTNLRDRL